MLTFMTQRDLIRANLVVTPVQTIRILPYLHFNPLPQAIDVHKIIKSACV